MYPEKEFRSAEGGVEVKASRRDGNGEAQGGDGDDGAQMSRRSADGVREGVMMSRMRCLGIVVSC